MKILNSTIFVLIGFLIPAISGAAVQLCLPLLESSSMDYLESDLRARDPKFEYSDGATFLSVLTADGRSRVNVGELRFKFREKDSSAVEITWSEVERDFRRQGVQNALFVNTVGRLPENTAVYSSLFSTNMRIAMELIMSRVNPDFDLKANRNLPLKELFQTCCLEKWRLLPNAERDAIITEAYVSTPAYKTRAKLGFEKFCGGIPAFDFSDSMQITATVCR